MGTSFGARRASAVLYWGWIFVALTGPACRRFNTAPDRGAASQPGGMTQPADLSSDGKAPLVSSPTTSAAVVPERAFESAPAGFRLRYPGEWMQKKTSEDLLLLVPAAGGSDRSITVDVPSIPLHLPGAMSMPLIENGFLDDLRKHHNGLKTEEKEDQAVAGSKARFVRSTWKENGMDFTDAALLIVHADKVYILSLDCPTAAYSPTHAAMDKIASSLQWLK